MLPAAKIRKSRFFTASSVSRTKITFLSLSKGYRGCASPRKQQVKTTRFPSSALSGERIVIVAQPAFSVFLLAVVNLVVGLDGADEERDFADHAR